MDHNSDNSQKKTVIPQHPACDAAEGTDTAFPVNPVTDAENLAWEEVSTEHIVQDEWIDFRRSIYRFPDGSV